MDPKSQITQLLADLGKDRKWLAENTGYSYFSVRDCLAPDGKKLSTRMHAAFLAAITREQEAAAAPVHPPLPDRLTLEVSPRIMERWAAAAASQNETTRQWAISELNRAAEAWHATQTRSELKVAEDPAPYRTGSKP